MADMCYYGNVMTTTRWWLCVTILHLQQYSHRLNLFYFFYLNGMTTRLMRWVGNVTRTRGANRILACKPEENEQPGILTHTWGSNIRMNVKAVVPKVYSAEPHAYAISSQRIHGYISVMATLKLTFFFELKVYIFF